MEDKIELSGKVAKFPKNTKAVKALSFLEKVKVNPNKLWYIVIEDQDTNLKMVKYNRCNDLNLFEYTEQIKQYYLQFYKNDLQLTEAITSIIVEGEKDYSIIKNIPLLSLKSGETLLSKITSDLIKLLSV